MRARYPIPVGFAPAEPWPSSPPATVRRIHSDEVLVAVGEGATRRWELNPYSGCAQACTHCPARQLAPFRDADWRVFERDIHARANGSDALARALRDGALAKAPLLLGTRCDPWQPAEKQAKVTRAALDLLARFGSVDLRAQTRSTLVARDLDLLRAIARRGKVRVTFPIASLDNRLMRLLEPQAPGPDRRFVAMETLARGGVRVGLSVAPVIAGLNDSLRSLEQLLRRARDCGASFASAAPLVMPAAARARLVSFTSRHDPELATRYDRLLARGANLDPELVGKLERGFAEACARTGLLDASRPVPPARVRSLESAPRQLSLF